METTLNHIKYLGNKLATINGHDSLEILNPLVHYATHSEPEISHNAYKTIFENSAQNGTHLVQYLAMETLTRDVYLRGHVNSAQFAFDVNKYVTPSFQNPLLMSLAAEHNPWKLREYTLPQDYYYYVHSVGINQLSADKNMTNDTKDFIKSAVVQASQKIVPQEMSWDSLETITTVSKMVALSIQNGKLDLLKETSRFIPLLKSTPQSFCQNLGDVLLQEMGSILCETVKTETAATADVYLVMGDLNAYKNLRLVNPMR